MAGKTAILSLKIIGDATGAQKAAAKTKKEISGIEKAAAASKKGMKAAGIAAGAGLMAGMMQALEADTAGRQLAAKLGLNPAEAKAAGQLTGDLYKSGYGASMADVAATTDAVASSLADFSTNGGADVERLTKKALDLAATFPEVGNGAAAAGVLVKTGLAKSADQAYDLMAGSLQKIPAQMRAELIPTVNEYAKHFADMGIDGATAMTMITEASKGGAIAMDKTGDAIKEFSIRAADGSKATAAAYETIGLNAETMATKIAAGGPKAQAAFQKTIEGLQSIKDPAKQAQTAIALFGTPLEDLGAAKIPEFLAAMAPAGASMDQFAGKAAGLGETINTGPAHALKELKRTAVDSFAQIVEAAMPVLQPVLAVLQKYAPVIGPIAVAIAGLAVVVWGVTAAMSAWNAAVLIGKGAVMAAQAAQWLWNAAMSANPVMLVVLAVAALVAGVIWAYENVGWFRDAVDTAGRIAKDVFNAIVGWVSDVVDWIIKAIDENEWLQSAFQTVGDVAATIFGGINDAISGTIGWIKDAIAWFGDLFGAKSDAAGAGGSAPRQGKYGMASPLMATADSGRKLMGASAEGPARFGAAPAPTAAVGRFGSGFTATAHQTTENNFTIEVKADATTDQVQLGRNIVKAINKALGATGQKKLAAL